MAGATVPRTSLRSFARSILHRLVNGFPGLPNGCVLLRVPPLTDIPLVGLALGREVGVFLRFADRLVAEQLEVTRKLEIVEHVAYELPDLERVIAQSNRTGMAAL